MKNSSVKKTAGNHEQLLFSILVLLIIIFSTDIVAKTFYVDSVKGLDNNPGTEEKSFHSLEKAIEIINCQKPAGPTTIKIMPGIYDVSKTLVIEKNDYTEKDRLTIEAAILPDEPQWNPALMPVILSTEIPDQGENRTKHTETYTIEVRTSHVTVRGLKFLGNPLINNWHCCISRIQIGLEDMAVTQCMFIGDYDGLDIYCATLATGDKFVVEHNIFLGCHTAAVFWDGPEKIGGKKNALRYCIVEKAALSAVWTCRTDEDFDFHNNIITDSKYFWLRERQGPSLKYHLRNCMEANNEYFSGYGVPSGATGQTGQEVAYEKTNCSKQKAITLIRDKKQRNYLHVIDNTAGSELGAGLFYGTISADTEDNFTNTITKGT